MSTRVCLLVTCLAAVGCSRSSSEAEPAARTDPGDHGGDDGDFDPKTLVSLELLASVDRVAPGAEFELAAHFTMKPGWHIYWENPGDSGLETRATFHGPDPVDIGEVRFPGPIAFVSPGDVASYGYEKDAALFARARAAADLPTGDGHGDGSGSGEGAGQSAGQGGGSRLEFRVDAKWLACRNSCVRGKGSATLSLPVGAGGAAANQAVLDPHRRRLPAPLSQLAGASARWSGDGDQRALVVDIPGARQVAFFPAARQPAAVAGHTADVSGNRARITVRYRGAATPSVPAGGVVRVDSGGEQRYYTVSVPWS